MTATTTVGDLTANDISSTELIVRHEGSTISGVLTNLEIQAETMQDTRFNGETETVLLAVHVTLTIGSITIGPLTRDHACQVIA